MNYDGNKDLFETVAMREFIGKALRKKNDSTHVWGVLSLLSAGVCAFSFLSYIVLSGMTQTQKPIVPFIFDSMTTDENGHSVAGVSVSFKNKILGVSDTFGRFKTELTGRAGSEILLQFDKKSDRGDCSSLLSVPVPTKSLPLQVVSRTVQMIRPVVKEQIQAASKQEETKSFLYQDIWFKTDAEKNTNLQALRDMLQKRSTELGLQAKENSLWQIKIMNVPFASDLQAKGLIRVIANDPNKSQQIDFLINDTEDPLICARKILYSLFQHVGKSPQTPGLSRFQIKLPDLSDTEHGVYISGLKATYLGDYTWSYLGQSQTDQMLSAIQNNQVIYRKAIRAQTVPETVVGIR